MHGQSCPRPPVVVLFALPREAAPFRDYVRQEPRLLLRVTGVGRACAERAVDELLRECAPSLVITSGFAGALRPGLEVGAVLYEVEPGHAVERSLQKAGARPARFHCAERMLVTAREKAECRRQTGADAVEMESGWIRARCRQAGLVAVTVRAISDVAEEDLPLDFNWLAGADGQLSFVKLAGALLKRPGAIPGLRRLQAQTALAAEALAQVLEGASRDWLAAG